jgi:hypothetical protein
MGNNTQFGGSWAISFLGPLFVTGKSMKRFDPSKMDEIEQELDELEDALRAQRLRRKRSSVPAAGGGAITTSHAYSEQLRPRPAAFAKAVSEGFDPGQSATRAGYRGARQAAWRLMRDQRVLDEIERLKKFVVRT